MRDEAVNRARGIFTVLDADGNGVLEEADFHLLSSRLEAAAVHSTPAQREAVRVSLRDWWTALVAGLDQDGDGRVDFEEYRGGVLSPQRFGATVAAFARALAALGDPEGDGTVTRERFTALMTAIGFAPDRVAAVFDAFGPSADDRIEATAWQAGVLDYFDPAKTDIPGDHLAIPPAS
ncbi:EF-hand domain-containing protein [Streptomyces sp. DSM 44915]|uniref:EF-hand domain-containing protein n=1 Tax=Streptomyces chisholmiae TaxID=3075540 RepID=A0ABU2JQQ2_9ACTN|nr:EF-hand domain-containing protein [Streptomyces sp. DSM 44915]MDT0267316.1 EF-hand domain-containing protein [Streptomyces sp. DSM 44915]